MGIPLKINVVSENKITRITVYDKPLTQGGKIRNMSFSNPVDSEMLISHLQSLASHIKQCWNEKEITDAR